MATETTLWIKQQKSKGVDRWVLSTPPELVPPLYNLNQEGKRYACVGGKVKRE
jgi:hypothetical protein